MKTSSIQTRRPLPPQRQAPKSKAIRILNTVSVGLLIAAAFSALVAVLFMTVIEPRRVVAKVRLNNGQEAAITIREFQTRLEFERERAVHRRKIDAAKAQHRFDESTDVDYRQLSTRAFAGGILDRMTREILIEEAAAEAKLSASAEEVDRIIEETDRVVLVTNPVPPVAGATVAAANPSSTALSGKKPNEVLRIKMDPRELPKNLREIIRTEVVEKKLRTQYFQRIPHEEERIQLRMVRFELEENAFQAAKTLQQEQSFDDLYQKAKAGAVSAASVIMHDWSSAAELQRDFNSDFSQVALKLSAGSHFAEPISAARGWYLIEAVGREMRPLSEEWRWQRGEDAFQRWVEGQQSRITQFPLWMKKVPLHPKAGRRSLSPSEMPPVNLPGGVEASPNRLKNGPKGKDQERGPLHPQRGNSPNENFPRGGDRSDPRNRGSEGGMKMPERERSNLVPQAPR